MMPVLIAALRAASVIRCEVDDDCDSWGKDGRGDSVVGDDAVEPSCDAGMLNRPARWKKVGLGGTSGHVMEMLDQIVGI